MASLASYIIAGLAAVLVTDYFNPIVGAGFGPHGLANAEPATAISTQVVDRSYKGDRLDRPDQAILTSGDFQPTAVRLVRLQVFHRPQPLQLPVGCDALASPIAGSPLSDLAGRCLTDNSDRRKLAAADHPTVSRHLI
jgi:hypothetical protein